MTTNQLDEIQARADAAQGAWEEFQQGIETTRFALEEANNSAEDVPNLIAALRAVEAVAEGWEKRAAHDLEFSKQVPDDIRDSILEGAGNMKHYANLIRAAIREALA